MTDDFTGVTDVYRWKISEAGLDLDRVSSDMEIVDGFPYQVYDAASMNNAWAPTDCPIGNRSALLMPR